ALTRAAGTLLLVRLAARARDLAATKRRVRALARGGALRYDDLVDERNVRLNVEEFGGQVDGADLLAGGVDDVDGGCVSHGVTLPSLRCGRRRCGPWPREPRP